MWDNLCQSETQGANGTGNVDPTPEQDLQTADETSEVDPGDGLTAVQRRAIEALLAHNTVTAAATACGVSRRTMHRFLKDPQFKDAFRKAQYDIVDHAHARLQGITHEAVEALRAVLNNPETPAGVRVSASRAALTLAYELVESEDVRRRIEVLEQLRKPNPYG